MNDKMKKSNILVVMVFFLIGVFFFTGYAAQGTAINIPMLNVNGTGKIITEPDTVEISISVVTEGKTENVQQENAGKTQKVIDALLKLGLTKEELETQRVNFYPMRRWTEKEGEVITGYRAENTILVTTTKIDKAGQITDTAVKNGAQNVGGLIFSLSDAGKERLLDKAIDLAVKDAKKQAEAAAKSLGVSIAGVQNVNVVKSSGGAPIYFEAAKVNALADAVVDTPVMPKDTEYIVTVDVAFKIK